MWKTTIAFDVKTSLTAENIENISAAVWKNMLQTIAESVEKYSAICQWIVTKDLNMLRMHQHIVPRMLNKTNPQKKLKVHRRLN
ncbi:hypothetical protein TNCV_2698361 [Trichonephila clavipes]|nr:hypothetical protein TNCV_2698361 [Trichonephila clavipes]